MALFVNGCGVLVKDLTLKSTPVLGGEYYQTVMVTSTMVGKSVKVKVRSDSLILYFPSTLSKEQLEVLKKGAFISIVGSLGISYYYDKKYNKIAYVYANVMSFHHVKTYNEVVQEYYEKNVESSR